MGTRPNEADRLLADLIQARADRDRADAQIRRLVAYCREFSQPRPYPLSVLAECTGMSISGVRTCYTAADIEMVAAIVGRRPTA